MKTSNALKPAPILAAALLLGACATSQAPAGQQRGSFIDRQGNRVILDKKRPEAAPTVLEGAGGVYECRNGQCQPLAPVQIQ
ncbi:hypothetical protein EBQ34_12280 [Vandammella animalimorsus]|uniref:Lipoprotein n=1 Tax=Vandammella animalimorsus TaxID=2029117 RepID=A0A3M6R5F3_9BURK|nr:hypothetical protein [Vandammella animalimorsus]RMX10497.1 hypothetical protein EBQ34_12280 [Vandammella animalimorsus]